LFRHKPVAELGELQSYLGTRSRATVFRVLRWAGYLASYSHAGRFYTLRSIPLFDVNGLWAHGDARFSQHGTLRETILYLIGKAPAGYTHEELEAVLGLRTHDTLRGLVEANLLVRDRLAGSYCYLVGDQERAAAQRQERVGAADPDVVTRPAPLDPARTVAVLVAVIHAPGDDANAIAGRLRADGVDVTDLQVQAVFDRYDLEKKTAPSRSRRSRR
jgi:hypothetical protein